MSVLDLKILYEDNHCLVVDKPAGELTMGDETGDESVVDRAKAWVRDRYNKPGNVWMGVVHRLDRPVSGVLLFARTSKSASRLADQFRRGAIRKHYTAVVQGGMSQRAGVLEDWLLKDRERNHVQVVTSATGGARKCTLEYEVEAADHRRSLLRLKPLTGRSHQIRVQLAHAGCPIIGDVRYGASDRLGQRILLHAHRLGFEHPTRKQPIVVESPLPDEITSEWISEA